MSFPALPRLRCRHFMTHHHMSLSYMKSRLPNSSLGSHYVAKRDFARIDCLSLSFFTYSHILAWKWQWSAVLTLNLKRLAIVKSFIFYFFGCIGAWHNLILIKWHPEAIYSPNWEKARKCPNNISSCTLGTCFYRQNFKSPVSIAYQKF